MAKPRIGIALGSGSARGWAHIGVLEALAEAGIEPEIVCGTSIGALVGAAQVAGRLPQLRDWVEAAGWREIVGLLDVRLTGGGLIDGKELLAFLNGLGLAGAIEDLPRRYAAVATDLASGREMWLQTGALHEAVRASAALPGLFSPALREGRWLVDGGLCNPVPVSVCRALGAEVIIAVNLNGDLVGRRFETPPATPAPSAEGMGRALRDLPLALRDQAAALAARLFPPGPATPGYFDVLANSINIMQDQITRTRLAGDPPHVLLLPRLRDLALMDFHRGQEAIAEGRACVEQALPALRRYL
ncbi:patatin-like phospholipase family protein [Falsiroseomonas tokyonensis]|uniref:Patatin-like phospholipase family protein n=1 Tax=Falsiroseomonas tokyonensis TaxID=430521 RepID=A0ABV7BMU8_9PROT|nr:patatin-like phospholipase family protein [Falsiroseomonas tokyonensis]MBU8536529.1 patatin-like phospholipase family protein [Falsiroseomonas tokyonensis]